MKKVIEVAMKYLGYKEQPVNHTIFAEDFDKNYPDFYNTRKSWPGGGAEWCDIYCDHAFVEAYGEQMALSLLCQPKKSAGAGCKFSAQYYRDAGRFIKRGEGDPQEGDQIFFGAYGNESHTGLVVKVENGRVYTIEGNSSDKVQEKNYSLTYNKISGYGRPDYSLVENGEEVKPAPTEEKKTDDVIAHEVIDGLWGNGEERKQKLTAAGYDYGTIQARVNELLKVKTPTTTKPATPAAKSAPVAYKVTAKSGLNVRRGPGVNYFKVAGKWGFCFGEKIYIDEIRNGWGHTVKSRFSGWVCMDYVVKV